MRLPVGIMPLMTQVLTVYQATQNKNTQNKDAKFSRGKTTQNKTTQQPHDIVGFQAHVSALDPATHDSVVASAFQSAFQSHPKDSQSLALSPLSAQDNDPHDLGVDLMGLVSLATKIAIPLYESRVAAGFPSPASDYEEGRLDLNSLLVKHPAATFLVRVQGDSMINVGIHPHDILVVDRSVVAASGKIVIAVLDGELTVKRLLHQAGRAYLMPENDKYPPIEVLEGQHFSIWGVVTNVIHPL